GCAGAGKDAGRGGRCYGVLAFPVRNRSPTNAAFAMTPATSNGCDSIATWLDGISSVVAFIVAANRRSRSGLIARSCFATMYDVGLTFHATDVTGVENAPIEIGPCV